MNINKDTKIKWVIRHKKMGDFILILTLEELEKSQPCFMKQVEDNIGIDYEIISREIIG